jgi:hypothetical protein
MAGQRLDFEIDQALETSLVTPRAGIASLIEVFRQSGAARTIEAEVQVKTRKRGLPSSLMVESLLALWAAGGERCEDLDRLREDKALEALLGHDLPAAQTARDFLCAFHEDDLPLLHAGKSTIPSESAPLLGLGAANRELIVDLQCRKPQRTATLDVDATVIASAKRAATRTYQGERGYQPVLVLWAEQDVIVADEFRDGNVPATVGNARVIATALAALPGKFDHIYVRGDSALYEHATLGFMEERGIGYAISADMHGPLQAAIMALPEQCWRPDRIDEAGRIREWSEVDFVPDDTNYKKNRALPPRRYLAIRIRPAQGDLLGVGADIKHFCIVTNRADPQGGSGLDIIRWHRGKAGTIEHAHDVLMNELAGWALPSQKFGANAAWLRLNVLLYNLLSAYKRVGLPADFHDARPKRLRFLFINSVGKLVRHARETILRFANATARTLAEAPRAIFNTPRPVLSGV